MTHEENLQKMKDSTPKVTSKIEVFSPSNAGIEVEKYKNYRTISDRWVKVLARMMLAMEWIIGDPIKYDEDGNLIDGFHRLNAVVAAGISVAFLVIRGLPRTSTKVIDTGKSRSVAQVLVGEGLVDKYGSEVAAIARQMAIAPIGADMCIHPREGQALYGMFSATIDRLIEIRTSHGGRHKPSAAVFGAFGRAFLNWPDEVVKIEDALIKYMDIKFEDVSMEPLRLLRQYFNSGDKKASSGRAASSDYIKAATDIAAWHDGRLMKQLRAAKGSDPLPLPAKYVAKLVKMGLIRVKNGEQELDFE